MLKDRGFVKSVIERSVSAGSKVLVFTVDLATPGRRFSEVHDGMENSCHRRVEAAGGRSPASFQDAK
jgi:isopentenyl diphosphate isomerase/L-lactate dehydrogenase-like FMN-dependent dehydrogenase